MINTKRDRKNLYLRLTKLDLLTKLKGVIKNQSKFDNPWVYVKMLPQARCDIYHRVFFEHLGRVHSFCRDCWKVVIRPRNLIQLFDLYEFEREIGLPCKCGIEVRDTVHGLYGGYFYCRSEEEGQERYREVKEFADYIGGAHVLLKRYCTEFEIGPGSLGPSNELPPQTKEEVLEEKEIEDIIYSGEPKHGMTQPDYLIAHIMRSWIHYAYKHGDKTYKDVTNGSPLFQPYVTYQKE